MRVPFLIFVLTFVSSCSRQKSLNVNDLRSDLTSCSSIAAESELFLDYVLQGRSTDKFATAHLAYLAQEASRIAEELGKSVPSSVTEAPLALSQPEIESLLRELTESRSYIGDRRLLSASRQRIERIRQALQKTQSSL